MVSITGCCWSINYRRDKTTVSSFERRHPTRLERSCRKPESVGTAPTGGSRTPTGGSWTGDLDSAETTAVVLAAKMSLACPHKHLDTHAPTLKERNKIWEILSTAKPNITSCSYILMVAVTFNMHIIHKYKWCIKHLKGVFYGVILF